MSRPRQHETVGRLFKSFGAPAIGFWMEMVGGKSSLLRDRRDGDRFNVSERAIGRTYHRAYDDVSYTGHEDGCGCYVCKESA